MENSLAACCASFYEQDWVGHLLGDSFHPGGLALTRRVLEELDLPPGSQILDVACGVGSSALMMARDYGLRVTGLDYSEANLDRASSRCQEAGLDIAWVKGAALPLPFPDDSFEAVLCECALSTFEDKPGALREMVRVLQPGGVLGLSDMALSSPLPEPLAARVAPWTCLCDARSLEENQRLVLTAGLRLVDCREESGCLVEMIVELKRALVGAALGQAALALPGGAELPLTEVRDLLQQARQEVTQGRVEYFRLSASLGPRTLGRRNRSCGCGPGPCC